jgi:hypothetical protein
MTTKQKYVATLLTGWIVPMTCFVIESGHTGVALAAVSIAWWHGYMAAKLEARLDQETHFELLETWT